MKNAIIRLFFMLALFVCPFYIFAQSDTAFWRIGPKIGFISHASIDEIYTPYLYSGNSAEYGFNAQKLKNKSLHLFSIEYAQILHTPVNIFVPAYYSVINYDENRIYQVSSEENYRSFKGIYMSMQYEYFRKIRWSFLPNDKIFIGFAPQGNFVFRSGITEPEVLALRIKPGFLYSYLFKKITISWKGQFTLLSIDIRKPYAGVIGQTQDYFDFNFYKDYLKSHYQFDFIPRQWHFDSAFLFEIPLSKRLTSEVYYQFSYLNQEKPRYLKSIVHQAGIVLYFNFAKHVKK